MKQTDYTISVLVDFVDELLVAPFDRARLRTLFNFFRKLGARRIYWIYTWRHETGALNPAPWLDVSANANRTHAAMGEFLPAAVEVAHELGMEIYAVYKHFDMAHNETFPFKSPGAQRYGKGLSSLSGEIFFGASFMADHQHQRIARRRDDLPADLGRRVIRKAVFTGRDDQLTRITPDTLSLAVSDDNGTYRPYRLPYTFTDTVSDGHRTLTLDGLEIAEPFMVFQTPFRDGHPTLGGVYASFLTLYDSEGRALPFTYGLVPRAAMKTDIDHELPYGLWPEYPLEGFVFNRWDVCDPNHPLIALDNRHGALAVAKGKELFVPGALSPAYPEVRALWLSHLEECLDAGVDGIDLRDAQHNRALVWEDYGFEAPVLEEYRRRHGVEPVPANMDRDNQVAIVADFLTQYYRQASRLIRGRGKKVQMHVQPLSRRYMGIKWDWPTWVAEGLMDAITLKMAWPNDAAVLEKMRDAAARGIGLYSCPFMPYESRLQRDGGVLDQFGTMLQAARDGGVENGCILYETAHIVQMRPDGSIRVKLPKVIDTLRNWNR